jgi:hypothetical protein
MSFTNLSSAQIKRLIALIKSKESLQARLDRINSELQGIESGTTAPKRRGRRPGSTMGAKPGRKPGRGRKRGKRLKAPLLHALKAAGSAGITVKDLAAKLKVKPGNIFSWFYTTGKKIKEIKKVGEAKYAMTS